MRILPAALAASSVLALCAAGCCAAPGSLESESEHAASRPAPTIRSPHFTKLKRRMSMVFPPE
ncbi:Uncharacterised protein [Bordetella pertussis]|nr:Uncharacterised protein [Bordetella pertussis]